MIVKIKHANYEDGNVDFNLKFILTEYTTC